MANPNTTSATQQLLTQLASQIDALGASEQADAAAIAAAQATLQALQAANAAQDSDLAALKVLEASDIAALKAQLAQVTGVANTPVDLSAVTTAISTLNDNYTALSAKVAALSSASPIALATAIMSIITPDGLKISGVLAGSTGTTNGGTTGSTATGDASPDPDQWSDTKVADKFYPADYGNALFPSPEGDSISIDQDGTLHGKPYLISAQGAVWKFDLDASGKPIPQPGYAGSYGFQASCNGQFVGGSGNGTTYATGLTKLIICQGQVYWVQGGGGLQKPEAWDGPLSGAVNTALAPFFTDRFYGYKSRLGIGTVPAGGTSGGTQGGTSGGVPVPADPPAPAVALGSTGKVIPFGPAETFTKPSDAVATAAPGDTVKYVGPAGTVYADTFKLPEGVTVDGGGRWPADLTAARAAWAAGDYATLSSEYQRGAVLDGSSFANQPTTYAGQMGGIAYMGNGNVIGFEIIHYGQQIAAHDGTAGLRAYGSCVGQIQGSDNYIHDCQNGIGPGGSKIISGPWTRTFIHNCGLNDGEGGAHCVYDTSDTTRSIIGPDFYADGGQLGGSAGHGYKSRCGASINMIAPFHLKGSDASALDIPNGSAAVCTIGAGIIEQVDGANPAVTQHTLIGYGVESAINGAAGVVLNGTILKGNVPGPNFDTNGPIDASKAVIQTVNPMGGGSQVVWPANYAHA